MPEIYLTNSTNWYIGTTTSTTSFTSNNFYVYQQPLTAGYFQGTPITAHTWEFEVPFATEQNAKVSKPEVAKRKARKLLKDNLSVVQWKQFLKMNYFEVISEFGDVYRITNGRARNVFRMKDGEKVEVLCAHPSIGCPNEDTMLAQKFALEVDEIAFRKIANIERLHGAKKLPSISINELITNLQVAA